MKLKDNRLVIEVEVNEGQTLADIKQIYPLPSDAIIHKIIPGDSVVLLRLNVRRTTTG